MPDHSRISDTASESRTWIVAEAWREDRDIARRIIGDALKSLVVIAAAIAVGHAVRWTPGATVERLHLFEAYHFFAVFALSAYFTLFLVIEVTVLLLRRIRREASRDS